MTTTYARFFIVGAALLLATGTARADSERMRH